MDSPPRPIVCAVGFLFVEEMTKVPERYRVNAWRFAPEKNFTLRSSLGIEVRHSSLLSIGEWFYGVEFVGPLHLKR